MIEVQSLSKRYGSALAVDDLSFTVQPGVVTGFLGPDGAGTSTTMRTVVIGFLAFFAGQAITDTVSAPDRLGAWVGYLVFTIRWVVLLAVGSWLLRRRDI